MENPCLPSSYLRKSLAEADAAPLPIAVTTLVKISAGCRTFIKSSHFKSYEETTSNLMGPKRTKSASNQKSLNIFFSTPRPSTTISAVFICTQAAPSFARQSGSPKPLSSAFLISQVQVAGAWRSKRCQFSRISRELSGGDEAEAEVHGPWSKQSSDPKLFSLGGNHHNLLTRAKPIGGQAEHKDIQRQFS